MIHAIYYRSRSCLAADADASAEVEAILAQARVKNDVAGLTGALVFSDHRFFQLLEGPAAALQATFDRIARDPRHGDVTVLYSGRRDARRFGGWSMAYVGRDPATLEACRGLSVEALPVLDRDASAGILRTMVEGVR